MSDSREVSDCHFGIFLFFLPSLKPPVVMWACRMPFVVSVFLKSLHLSYKVVLNFSDLVGRENIHKFVPCHEKSKCKGSKNEARNG